MEFKKFHAVAQKCRQATLSIDFVIVGGGIAGLACAVALCRVGHRVTVLEGEGTLDHPSGPCRIPPNLSKILYHWGLKREVRSIGLRSQAINVLIYETNELLGYHSWHKEVLKEARGEFLFTSHSALRKLLYDLAISCGADVQLNANVTAVDPATGIVELDSGVYVEGSVIIGADGPQGLTVQDFRALDEGLDTGMTVYTALIPQELIAGDEDLAPLCNEQNATSMFNWLGDSHSVLCFPIGDGSEFAFVVYAPSRGNARYWKTAVLPKELEAALATAHPKLQKLGRLAQHIQASTIFKYPELEDWIHEDGDLVLLGEAAHPLIPGSIQSPAMALEDAAVLGKIFSHLYRRDQIETFLWAYQELRFKRRNSVAVKEEEFLRYITMPPGEEQQTRDQTMIEKREAGLGILEAFDDGEEPAEWLEVKDIFVYDAEDEAENWWNEWGILRERADSNRFFNFEAPAVQILVG